MRIFLTLIICTVLVTLLLACQQPGPTPPLAVATTASIVPSPTSEPTATPPLGLDHAEAVAEISAHLLSRVAPTPTPQTPDDFVWGIGGVDGFRLAVDGETELWIGHTFGSVNFDAKQTHLVGVYRYEDGKWYELGVTSLASEGQFLDQSGVAQIDLGSGDIWLTVDTTSGAHSGTFDLLRFDGQELGSEFSAFNASPGVATAPDLDRDGTAELIINQSNPYVFCYACGVIDIVYQVLDWDDTARELKSVTLTELDGTDELATLNHEALAQVEAGLWNRADETIRQAIALAPDDSTVLWNFILIDLHARALREQETYSGFSILTDIFYGDYEQSVTKLAEYEPAEIFKINGAPIAGTAAVGWEDALAEYLIERSDRALAYQADLAPAYFLRAWGRYLQDPANPDILTDLELALNYDPDNELFAASYAHLNLK